MDAKYKIIKKRGERVMRKKLFAVLCAAAMTMSLVACGNTNNQKTEESSAEVSKQSTAEVSQVQSSEPVKEVKDPVVIDYWYRNGVGEQEYTKEVEEKLNEILANTEGYEHMSVKLHPSNDYKTDFALAQTAGEKIDVFVTFSLPDLTTQIENGALYQLDDLVAANPEIAEDIPEWLMDYGKFDGKQYYIPNYQQMVNQYFVWTPTEFFEASGYDYDEVQAMFLENDFDGVAKFLEDLTLAARKTTGKDTKWIHPELMPENELWLTSDQGIEDIYMTSKGSFFYWDNINQCVGFSDSHEMAQKGYLKNGEWNANGLIYENYLVDNKITSAQETLGEYSYVMWQTQTFGTAEMAQKTVSERYGFDVTMFRLSETVTMPKNNAAGGVAISGSTKYPEEAAAFIALLFNSKYEEFYNTLVYGLEGIHYTPNGDGTIKTLEFDGSQGNAETTYCYWKWVGGNTFNAWLNQSMTQEQEDYIKNEINENPNNPKSALVGFALKTAPVETEIAQVNSVIEEFRETLLAGAKGKDTESYMKEYYDKLENAGLSKIIAEFEAQVKEFLGK